jgi:hypothetical protein
LARSVLPRKRGSPPHRYRKKNHAAPVGATWFFYVFFISILLVFL